MGRIIRFRDLDNYNPGSLTSHKRRILGFWNFFTSVCVAIAFLLYGAHVFSKAKDVWSVFDSIFIIFVLVIAALSLAAVILSFAPDGVFDVLKERLKKIKECLSFSSTYKYQ